MRIQRTGAFPLGLLLYGFGTIHAKRLTEQHGLNNSLQIELGRGVASAEDVGADGCAIMMNRCSSMIRWPLTADNQDVT